MKKTPFYLTYAGAFPFVCFAGFLVLGIKELPFLGSTERVLSLYALIIATFLAGVHWGQHLHIRGKWHRRLPILSNVMVIFLWLGFSCPQF